MDIVKRQRLVRTSFIVALTLAPFDARAQAPSAPAPQSSGWRDGFFVQSENGDYRLQVGALVHADGRFTLGGDDGRTPTTDTFLIRRARPYVRGRFARNFEFYVNPDFAGGVLVLQDAYVDTVFAPYLRLRAGKAKTPFGLERLQSVSNILFFERALPTSLVPNRDAGIQVMGDIAGGLVSYAGGVMNGVVDGGSGDVDANDGKDLAGRIVVRPFTHGTYAPLRPLLVGIAGTRGHQEGAGALPTLRTSMLQQAYLSYAGSVADGVRTRYSPQVSYYYKSFGGLVEYVHSQSAISEGELSDHIDHDSWQIAASWVITGEAASDGGGIRPRANFDFGAGHLGAFQVAARYHALEVDDRAFALDFATAGSSRKAEAWTVGLNWVLTPNFKYVVNFERTVFDGDPEGPRKPENALAFRTQVAF
jgi:phosphate-selective porin OprO and OprP